MNVIRGVYSSVDQDALLLCNTRLTDKRKTGVMARTAPIKKGGLGTKSSPEKTEHQARRQLLERWEMPTLPGSDYSSDAVLQN